MNNKALLGIFALLLVIFLASRIFKGSHQKSNFDPEIVKVDTSLIDQILITPKTGAGEAFSLIKKGNQWEAHQNGKVVPAVPSAMTNYLGRFVQVESKRIVSKSPEKWSIYEVEEGSGTRIQALSGNKTLADFIVGSFKFDQATRSASSYMRRTNENDVYLVDGFLSMNFNQTFDQFRDKSFLQLTSADATKVTLSQSGEEQAIQKLEDGWYYAGMEKLDSAAVAQYLSGLSNVSGINFVDDFNPTQSNIEHLLTIESNNVMQPIKITSYSYADPATPFVLNSSLNPNAYFASDSAGIYQRIFSKLEALLPN